jgi:D-lactate dehydrogenase
MQMVSRLFPQHLPKRMVDYRDRYEHHLMLKMAGDGVDEARRFLKSIFPRPRVTSSSARMRRASRLSCSASPPPARPSAIAPSTGARWRTVALDVALRRNDQDWFETLPDDVSREIRHKLYYGHFFCHVFHQDYIVKKGRSTLDLEHRLWKLLDARGAQYPAEHNVGHLYEAKPALISHYQSLDPCNCFNPGIGQTSKYAHWRQRQPPSPFAS